MRLLEDMDLSWIISTSHLMYDGIAYDRWKEVLERLSSNKPEVKHHEKPSELIYQSCHTRVVRD